MRAHTAAPYSTQCTRHQLTPHPLPHPDVCPAAVRIWERTQMVRLERGEHLTYMSHTALHSRTSWDLTMDVDSDIDILCDSSAGSWLKLDPNQVDSDALAAVNHRSSRLRCTRLPVVTTSDQWPPWWKPTKWETFQWVLRCTSSDFTCFLIVLNYDLCKEALDLSDLLAIYLACNMNEMLHRLRGHRTIPQQFTVLSLHLKVHIPAGLRQWVGDMWVQRPWQNPSLIPPPRINPHMEGMGNTINHPKL